MTILGRKTVVEHLDSIQNSFRLRNSQKKILLVLPKEQLKDPLGCSE